MKFMDVSFWRNMEFLDIRFWGNSVKQWLTALVVAITVVIFLRLVKWILVRYLTNRADQDRWDVVELTAIAARRTQLPFVMIFAIYASFQVLDLPQRLLPWIFSITMAALILQLTLWANATVDYFLNRSQQRNLERNAARVTTLRAAGLIFKCLIYLNFETALATADFKLFMASSVPVLICSKAAAPDSFNSSNRVCISCLRCLSCSISFVACLRASASA